MKKVTTFIGLTILLSGCYSVTYAPPEEPVQINDEINDQIDEKYQSLENEMDSMDRELDRIDQMIEDALNTYGI